jgi:hypothetical protein
MDPGHVLDPKLDYQNVLSLFGRPDGDCNIEKYLQRK